MSCAMIQYNSYLEYLVYNRNTSHLILFQQPQSGSVWVWALLSQTWTLTTRFGPEDWRTWFNRFRFGFKPGFNKKIMKRHWEAPYKVSLAKIWIFTLKGGKSDKGHHMPTKYSILWAIFWKFLPPGTVSSYTCMYTNSWWSYHSESLSSSS